MPLQDNNTPEVVSSQVNSPSSAGRSADLQTISRAFHHVGDVLERCSSVEEVVETQGIAGSLRELTAAVSQLERRIDTRMSRMEAKVERLDAKVEELRANMDRMRVELGEMKVHGNAQ